MHLPVRLTGLTLLSFALSSSLACTDVPPESVSLTALSDDPGKADSATPITMIGGLAIEESRVVSLPVVPAYVGVILLAPEGADLSITTAGKLATRVTVFGPRAADGSYGTAIDSQPGKVAFHADVAGAYLVVPQPRYVGQSGTTTVTASCSGSACFGQCSATPPSLVKRKWAHTTASAIVKALGSPRHRAYDQVIGPDSAPTLSARFTYGAVDKDLEDENVDLWIRSCPGWEKVASVRTDDDGVARVDLGHTLPPGDYNVLWHVPGDNSTATGVVSVWEPGQPIVVSDIDGTLTTNDAQVFKALFLGTDPALYPDSQEALWTMKRKGYRVEYLTGRPELLGRMSKAWLATHGYPPGPTILTSETLEVLPTEDGVGDFKTEVLETLTSDIGVWIFAAFGNATTDIFAYHNSDIPNDHLFIIGKHAGEEGTTAVSSYGNLLPTLRAMPDAELP